MTNCQYRLPTEAEWEYAYRSHTTTPVHFGKTITTELANYRGPDDKDLNWSSSYGTGPKGEYREETTPVNQFEGDQRVWPLDIHGNVWEWCQDYWNDNYEGAPIDGSAWVEGEDSDRRIIRGGSWDYIPRLYRSVFRAYLEPGTINNHFGFRVVCSAPRALQPPTG